jgi:hypothetical protein
LCSISVSYVSWAGSARIAEHASALSGFLAALFADGAVELLSVRLYLVGFERFAAHPTPFQLFFRYDESLLFDPRFQENHCLNMNVIGQ